MRFLLLLIMTASGDVETTQIAFESLNQCEKAKRDIMETMAKATGEVTLQGAYCMEVRY